MSTRPFSAHCVILSSHCALDHPVASCPAWCRAWYLFLRCCALEVVRRWTMCCVWIVRLPLGHCSTRLFVKQIRVREPVGRRTWLDRPLRSPARSFGAAATGVAFTPPPASQPESDLTWNLRRSRDALHCHHCAGSAQLFGNSTAHDCCILIPQHLLTPANSHDYEKHMFDSNSVPERR